MKKMDFEGGTFEMRFLFQGDSITDAGRDSHENPAALGAGYVRLIAADLTFEHTDYEFLNTAVGGNRVVDLLARWKKDCLNLKPDVLTILIGVNDVWHEIGSRNGVHNELFGKVYGLILEETVKTLPDAKLILMGSYVTHGTATDGAWEEFSSEVGKRRETTKRLAEKYGCRYIDLQERFDSALAKAPASHWTVDGVHPTAAGHKLIAMAWEEAFKIGKSL